MSSSPFRVVIAGGGVAALEAVLAFQELDPDHALSVEVIAPDTRFVYRPLSVRDPFGPRSTRAAFAPYVRACDPLRTSPDWDETAGRALA